MNKPPSVTYCLAKDLNRLFNSQLKQNEVNEGKLCLAILAILGILGILNKRYFVENLFKVQQSSAAMLRSALIYSVSAIEKS